jgi:hypothetical protein
VASSQIFLLSPARCDGRRAKVLLNPDATFEMAQRVSSPDGAPIGDVFSFLSGLYFRGKLSYARTFARRADSEPAVHVITTDRGLVPPETPVRREDLLAFSSVDLAAGDERYVTSLRRDANRLATALRSPYRIVLLGSIATGKYVDVLTEVFGERLVFPTDFVGRGDMSRGGILLRRVSEQRELDYAPVLGAKRHGRRPPKLERIR